MRIGAYALAALVIAGAACGRSNEQPRASTEAPPAALAQAPAPPSAATQVAAKPVVHVYKSPT